MIVYFEFITLQVTLVFPAIEQNTTENHIAVNIMLFCVCFYTGSRAQIFVSTLLHAIIIFLHKHLIYEQEMLMQVVFFKVSLVVAVFLANTFLAIVINYISKLQEIMKVTNFENIKLLDGMHEGLLILSLAEPRQALFCNKSAHKLLQRSVQFYELHNAHQQSDLDRNEDKIQQITEPRMFHPVKLNQFMHKKTGTRRKKAQQKED